MRRTKRFLAGLAALAALAFGGAAIAQAGESDQTPPAPANEREAETPEADGPGGHADDPNDENAKHEFEGEE